MVQHLNTQLDNDVLIIPDLPSQVTGIWGDWHQTYGRDGYPAIYVTLCHNKPVMRKFPVDSGATWTWVASAVDQVREQCERHNVDVAALEENKRGIGVTPEFQAHLTFNHCGDSVMKLMGRQPELYNMSLGKRSSIAGQAKHCLGCIIANMRLGAHAMYSHALAQPAEAAVKSYHADVAGPIRPLGIGHAKYVLAAVDEYTRYLHVIPMHRKSQAASLLAQLFEHVRVQVIRSKHAGVLRPRTDKGGEFKS